MSYRQYMQSEQWARVKAAYYARHRQQCRACGSKQHIDLHHRSYDRMGYETDRDLVPLCESCHAVVHQLHRAMRGQLSLTAVTGQVIRRSKAAGSTWTPKSAGPRFKRRVKDRAKDPVTRAFG
jgi:phage terminase large subunit GpA-like protein